MNHEVEYLSRGREVVCWAEADGHGGYLGKVRVTAHHGEMSSEAVHEAPAPDATPDRALSRAVAWAELHYPRAAI